MNAHVKLYFMRYLVNYYLQYYRIKNIQLNNAYNYVNLITFLHHVAKLHMLSVK